MHGRQLHQQCRSTSEPDIRHLTTRCAAANKTLLVAATVISLISAGLSVCTEESRARVVVLVPQFFHLGEMWKVIVRICVG